MEVKKNCGKCFQCKYFDCYYTREIKQFKKAKCGWCKKNKEVVKLQNSCVNYIFKQKNVRYDYSIKRFLSDVLTELSELRQILEEENNAKNEM